MTVALATPLYPLEAIRSDAGQVQVRTNRGQGRQGQLVATFYPSHEALEHLPDLLMAGPDLLAASKTAMAYLKDYRSNLHSLCCDTADIDEAIAKFDDALRKARGAA